MVYEVLMFLVFFITGFIASGLGAIPASSSNIAVVTTTHEKSFQKGLMIAFGAGIGSAFLAFLALLFSRIFNDYFKENPWLQILVVVLFFIIGLLILLRNKINIDFDNPLSANWNMGNFWKGVILAVANPMALFFWVLIIGVANRYLFNISKESPLLNLVVFFGGIFLGKVTTLYYYAKLSKNISDKKSKKNSLIYTVIGALLVTGSLFQAGRLIFEGQ